MHGKACTMLDSLRGMRLASPLGSANVAISSLRCSHVCGKPGGRRGYSEDEYKEIAAQALFARTLRHWPLQSTLGQPESPAREERPLTEYNGLSLIQIGRFRRKEEWRNRV